MFQSNERCVHRSIHIYFHPAIAKYAKMIKINITSDTCTLITFINYIKQQTTSVLLTYPSQREREREGGGEDNKETHTLRSCREYPRELVR